jgi:hypothetical protein
MSGRPSVLVVRFRLGRVMRWLGRRRTRPPGKVVQEAENCGDRGSLLFQAHWLHKLSSASVVTLGYCQYHSPSLYGLQFPSRHLLPSADAEGGSGPQRRFGYFLFDLDALDRRQFGNSALRDRQPGRHVPRSGQQCLRRLLQHCTCADLAKAPLASHAHAFAPSACTRRGGRQRSAPCE